MKDLINWTELSIILAGNKTSVTQNRIPKKYQSKVNSLIDVLENWKNEQEY